MRWSRFVLFCWVCLSISSCRNEVAERLIGDWQAYAYVQQDSTIAIDLTPVKLSFNAQGQYCYHSNLLHQECGHYQVSKQGLLKLQDTTQAKVDEVFLGLQINSKDSLVVEMEEAGMKSRLSFYRYSNQRQ